MHNNNNRPLPTGSNQQAPNQQAATPFNGGHKSPNEQQPQQVGGGPDANEEREQQRQRSSDGAQSSQPPAAGVELGQGQQTATTQTVMTISTNELLPLLASQQVCAPQFSARNLFWNSTRVGQVARQPCPDGSLGRVAWTCELVAGQVARFSPGQAPDFSQCSSIWLARLGQQLGAAATSNQWRPQAELSVRALLGELVLMVRTRELFAEDLRRLDAMLGQVLAQQRSLDGAGAGDFREELLERVATICSQLFHWSQRQAWLELPDWRARHRLEARLLVHLRDAAQLWAAAASAHQPANWIRQPNVLVGQVAVQQALDLAAAGEASDSAPLLLAGARQPFEADSVAADSAAAELRAPGGLLRQLSALGECNSRQRAKESHSKPSTQLIINFHPPKRREQAPRVGHQKARLQPAGSPAAASVRCGRTIVVRLAAGARWPAAEWRPANATTPAARRRLPIAPLW